MSSTLGLARKAGLETKPAGICRCSCLLGVRRNSVLDPTSSIRKPMGQCPKESITVLSCCRQCEQLFKQHDDNLALSTFALEPVLSPLRSDSSVLKRHTHTTRCVALDGLPTGQTISISQVCCSRVPHVQPASVDIFEPCDSGGGPAHPAKPQRCQRRHGAMTRNFTHHDGLM